MCRIRTKWGTPHEVNGQEKEKERHHVRAATDVRKTLMADETDNGEPAFPRTGFRREVEGMSLRDYFAAKFAHAEMVTCGMSPEPAQALAEAAEKAGQTIEQRVAFISYRLADAMLAQRKK